MARKCTICGHKKRDDIERTLIERQPFRSIADRFTVSKSALIRHHDDHLPASLVKAHEAAEVARADDLLAQVRDLRDKALGILAKAESTDDLRAAIAAIREARGCLELLGKLAGELKDAPTINVILMPEWRTLQTVILTALEPHHDARLSVMTALGNLTNGRALPQP